jgi:hypothetical protein
VCVSAVVDSDINNCVRIHHSVCYSTNYRAYHLLSVHILIRSTDRLIFTADLNHFVDEITCTALCTRTLIYFVLK